MTYGSGITSQVVTAELTHYCGWEGTLEMVLETFTASGVCPNCDREITLDKEEL